MIAVFVTKEGGVRLIPDAIGLHWKPLIREGKQQTLLLCLTLPNRHNKPGEFKAFNSRGIAFEESFLNKRYHCVYSIDAGNLSWWKQPPKDKGVWISKIETATKELLQL